VSLFLFLFQFLDQLLPLFLIQVPLIVILIDLETILRFEFVEIFLVELDLVF